MLINNLDIEGVFEIIKNPIMDSRGFFMRTYDDILFTKNNIKHKWIQENHSKSNKKNIIRGLHLQLSPYSETKLIRCISGSVLDIYVDLRIRSKTFGSWGSCVLSSKNYKSLLIPRGFAHGFCTLTNESEVVYKVDNYYSKSHEIGIKWDDPDLNIKWPTKNPVMSEKDKNNITLKEYLNIIKSKK